MHFARPRTGRDYRKRLGTFWNTGEASLARAASADFRDNTLPAGLPQGVDGVLKAFGSLRAAAPDSTATNSHC